jgi:hypothetical protein
VQGDERDVVLFSTGFSVDDRGVLPLNFGPLNRVGGERRLNVAVTRARRQVVVVSSFDPAQLRAEQTSSVGVKHLRAYLDLPRWAPTRCRATPGRSPSRTGTARRSRRRCATGACRAHRRRPLGVPRRPVGGAAGHPGRAGHGGAARRPGVGRRRTVGDRDGLPVEVLSGMLGWPVVERVWLPTWLRDREAVLDRLAAAVAAVPTAAPSAVEEPVAVAPVVEAPAIPAPADPPASRCGRSRRCAPCRWPS